MKTAEEMKEFKGSKGEWFVSGGTSVVSMPSQCKITNSVSGWNYDEAKANAQLIATSPELLQALQKLVELRNRKLGDGKFEGYFREMEDAWDNAENAINKALGL